MKRGQIVSVDLLNATMLFLLFAAAFSVLILIITSTDTDDLEYETLYAFDNLEANTAFFNDYEVDRDAYATFATTTNDLDDYVLSNQTAGGIGLGTAAYDTCLYFTDTDGTILSVNGVEGVGTLRDGLSCDDQLPGASPCDGYDDAITTSKPVLFNEGSPSDNRIIRMNVVVCER